MTRVFDAMIPPGIQWVHFKPHLKASGALSVVRAFTTCYFLCPLQISSLQRGTDEVGRANFPSPKVDRPSRLTERARSIFPFCFDRAGRSGQRKRWACPFGPGGPAAAADCQLRALILSGGRELKQQQQRKAFQLDSVRLRRAEIAAASTKEVLHRVFGVALVDDSRCFRLIRLTPKCDLSRGLGVF